MTEYEKQPLGMQEIPKLKVPPQLLPCPCCGSKPLMGRYHRGYGTKQQGYTTLYFTCCDIISQEARGIEKAITNWNDKVQQIPANQYKEEKEIWKPWQGI